MQNNETGQRTKRAVKPSRKHNNDSVIENISNLSSELVEQENSSFESDPVRQKQMHEELESISTQITRALLRSTALKQHIAYLSKKIASYNNVNLLTRDVINANYNMSNQLKADVCRIQEQIEEAHGKQEEEKLQVSKMQLYCSSRLKTDDEDTKFENKLISLAKEQIILINQEREISQENFMIQESILELKQLLAEMSFPKMQFESAVEKRIESNEEEKENNSQLILKLKSEIQHEKKELVLQELEFRQKFEQYGE